MTDNVSPRVHADLALAVYLEPHAEGRRVLLLGEAEGALADRFDGLASQLEIIDPGAREPSRGEVPELPFEDRSFDLVLVCDVAALPEPRAQALRELRRVLSRTGLLAVVHPQGSHRRRRGGPPHVWLEKLLAAEFRNVRLLAQSPLSVYSLGDITRRDGEEISVDSSLTRAQEAEPERLLGLASESRIATESRVWIEVPASPSGGGGDESAQSALFEELRRAEDEAREALHRESDLLRKLEIERKALREAEHLAERARVFERKLLAAEADYDDAVARVRYFESAIGEREAAATHDRERREAAERELAHAKGDLASARERLQRLEGERDAAKAEYDTLVHERDELEQRLTELGQQVLGLERDKKHHEQVARDLLEELRRLERDKTTSVEHDARVAELEAERERAVQRALDAEVAREAAQMRADELRSELAELSQTEEQRSHDDSARSMRAVPRTNERQGKGKELTASELAPPRSALESDAVREDARASIVDFDEPPSAEAPAIAAGEPIPLGHESARVTELEAQAGRLRGECHGLRLRLNEAEIALEAAESPGVQLQRARRELEELRLRHVHAEAALHGLREAQRESAPGEVPVADDVSGDEALRRLEEQLVSAEQRIFELTRELEEADRFAEVHAEDAERLTALEAELEQQRERVDELEAELRAADQDLHGAREESDRLDERLTELSAELERARTAAEEAEQRASEKDDAQGEQALREAREVAERERDRAAHAEHALRAAHEEVKAERERQRALEDELRTLRDEVARFDARLASAHAELERVRAQAGDAEDLRRAREEAARAGAEASAKLELAERREAERDDARAALADARAILAQLAVRVGADENDPPSIVQALLARDGTQSSERDRLVDELRGELSQRDRRIEQLERWLHEARDDEARARAQPSGSSEY